MIFARLPYWAQCCSALGKDLAADADKAQGSPSMVPPVSFPTIVSPQAAKVAASRAKLKQRIISSPSDLGPMVLACQTYLASSPSKCRYRAQPSLTRADNLLNAGVT